MRKWRHTNKKRKQKKNQIHVKKVGFTSEFLFGIYWWSWKTTIKKNCWNGPKNIRISIFPIMYFFKKNIKNMACECDRLKLVIMGHFLPFTPSHPIPPKNKKSEFWKNKKNCWRYHHFTHVYQKLQSYEVWFLSYRVRLTETFWAIFCPFTPLLTLKQKIRKNVKKPWPYYPFTHVYHKWGSYDVWFLR